MPRIIRKLVWFRRDNDELAGEAILRGVRLRELRAMFGHPQDDPDLYLSYEVHARQKAALEEHLSQPILLNRFAYFVEAEQVQAGVGAVARGDVA